MNMMIELVPLRETESDPEAKPARMVIIIMTIIIIMTSIMLLGAISFAAVAEIASRPIGVRLEDEAAPLAFPSARYSISQDRTDPLNNGACRRLRCPST